MVDKTIDYFGLRASAEKPPDVEVKISRSRRLNETENLTDVQKSWGNLFRTEKFKTRTGSNNKPKIDKEKKEPYDYEELRERWTFANIPEFAKFKSSVRNSVGSAFQRKGFSKPKSTEEILGITLIEFYYYIQSKFAPWMSMDNYGNSQGVATDFCQSWQFDHVVPIAMGVTIEDIIDLNHYTNFQPLCSYENQFVKKAFFGNQKKVNNGWVKQILQYNKEIDDFGEEIDFFLN